MQYDLLLKSVVARASEKGSIRQAALKVGITDVSLGMFIRWRETNAFPSNETVVKLADIAGFDKIKSHFATMAAKTKEPYLSEAYEQLAQGMELENKR